MIKKPKSSNAPKVEIPSDFVAKLLEIIGEDFIHGESKEESVRDDESAA